MKNRKLYYQKILEVLMKTPTNIVYLFLSFFYLHNCCESPLQIVKNIRNIMCIFFVTDVMKLIDIDVIVNSSGAYH